MVSRSSEPATFGFVEQRFTELTQVLNERTSQLQEKFQEVDATTARQQQMLQILEHAMGARVVTMEEALTPKRRECQEGE